MLTDFYNKLLDFIYPPKCGFCGEITASNSFICDECKDYMKQEYANRCIYCGKVVISDEMCEECSKKEIFYNKLVFFSEYTNEFRDKIHSYKFFGKKFYYNFFAELLFDKLIGTKADIIVSVPISKERFKERGYNQSELISKKLSQMLKIPYDNGVLLKIKNSEKQSMQNFRKRQESVKNIFKVTDNNLVRGKDVILIDDVFTTGATANECSRRLIEAGAKSIIVAVISISHTLK